MSTTRFRLQYKFWLDLNKAEESELADIIADLKQERTFSRVVRDGIRLMVSLMQGRLDLLLALFPGVEDAFYARFQEQQPDKDSTLQAQLERLEALLLAQGNTPITGLSAARNTPNIGPKSLAVPSVPGPSIDPEDSLHLVVRKAQSDDQSARNFLDSAFALQQ